VKVFRTILMVLAFISIQAHAKDESKPAGKIFKDCADCPEMVVIRRKFRHGSNSGDDNEKPVHRVTIKSAFAIGKTEVTQGLWKSIMGNNPANTPHAATIARWSR